MEIGIIGFGVSGIACARWALHYGFKPIVYEKSSSFGGVWLSKAYPNLKLQTNKYSYCFSDIPMKDSVSLYPTIDEIREYLSEYIEYHNLETHVQYNSEILNIIIIEEGKKYKLFIKNLLTNQIEEKIFDYIAICSGFYTTNKNANALPNCYTPTDFSPIGKYYKDYSDLFNNKRVAVIGNGPSGCDIVNLAVESNAKSVQLFYKSDRWIFSRYLFSFSLHFLTSRLFLKIANKLPFIIVKIAIIILFMIPLLANRYFIKIDFPDKPVSRNNLVLNDYFYYNLIHKRFQYIKEPIIEIRGNVLKSDRRLYNYDVLIDARGYNNDIKFLKLDNIPKLYKHIIHTNLKNIGFVGFVASFNWLMVSDLQSRWLMEYFLGTINNNITSLEQINWISKEISKRVDYFDLAYDVYDYCDELAKDLNLDYQKIWTSVPIFNTWASPISNNTTSN